MSLAEKLIEWRKEVEKKLGKLPIDLEFTLDDIRNWINREEDKKEK